MARPANADAAVTRARILDAALELFADRGFYGTSMRQIAAAAGLTSGALYHHFESKEAILWGVLNDVMGRGQGVLKIGEMLGQPGQRPALRPLLTRFCQAVLEVFQLPFHKKIFRVLMGDGMRLVQEGVMPSDMLVNMPRMLIGGIFATLMDEGIIRRVDPEYLAMALMGPMVMYRQFKMVWGLPNNTSVMDIDTFIRHHVDHMVAFLSPETN